MTYFSRRAIRWSALAIVAGAVPAIRASAAQAQATDQQGAPQVSPEERLRLEQQFRRQVAHLVRDKLQLSDDQFHRLVETNQRYEGQRRQLVQEERGVLVGLREEQLSATPNQQHVSQLIDQRMKIEQQRLAITQEEQRDLGAFLTPVQRAQYGALQEQIRRRLQEIRRRRLEGDGAFADKAPENAAERQEKRAERQADKRAARPRAGRVP
ncbi:MAG: hypothetical protein ABJD07_06885 [Gemmatimonadaceae bacterium]